MKKNRIIDIVLWTFWLAINFTQVFIENDNFSKIFLSVAFNFFVVILLFYANLFLCKRLLSKKRYGSYLSFLLLLFIAFCAIGFTKKIFLMDYLDRSSLVNRLNYGEFLFTRVYVFSQYIVLSLGYWAAISNIQKERELRLKNEEQFKLLEEQQIQKEENILLQQDKLLLQQANLLLEKKQIETENAYLRAQINPHFLHNTLNFFFSKSINVGAYDLADAIMVLSDVMRFSLEAKPDENGRVEIAHEMDHMKNVIKINEIRFNKTYCLDLKIEGDTERAKIIPLVLITMVENAFKYGELFDPEHPLKIQISIDANRFRFYLHNKKRARGAHEGSHGIGVANSIKRLTAAYGADGYAIDIDQDTVFYSVTLTIYDLSRVEQAVLAGVADAPVINKQPINELV
jgi:sensor histidine kinase YesM